MPKPLLCHGCSRELPWDDDAEAFEGIGIHCYNCAQDVRVCMRCEIDGPPAGYASECPTPYADEFEMPREPALDQECPHCGRAVKTCPTCGHWQCAWCGVPCACEGVADRQEFLMEAIDDGRALLDAYGIPWMLIDTELPTRVVRNREVAA